MSKIVAVIGGVFVVAIVIAAALFGVQSADAAELNVENAAGVPNAEGIGGPPGEISEEFREYMHAAMHTAMAEALGMTEAELTAALDAGQKPREIAEELGIDETPLRETLNAARTEAIQQAVADGLITQEQADWLASHPPRGGRGGGRGGRGGGQGGPQGTPAPQS